MAQWTTNGVPICSHPISVQDPRITSDGSRRRAVRHVCCELSVSKNLACKVLNQRRSTQRYKVRVADDEVMPVERIVALATKYGRYGYRRIAALIRAEGWYVNHKREERILRL